MKAFNAVMRMLMIGVLMALADSAGAQQAYPNRPIRLIVPFPPGGTTDPVARLIAPALAERLGQPVIVDNRAGGNTIIGTEAVVKSKPDGYTLLILAHTNLVIRQLFGGLPYDVMKDLAPVASTAKTELILLANSSLPANNMQELIALAKSKPGQLNNGSVGSGGITHLAIELLNILAGINIQNIPYKGAGPAITDVISGQVQVALVPPLSAFGFIKSGRLKGIAITGETRLLQLPQVPTFAESGMPDFNPAYWYGVYAAADTPKEIIDRLTNEIAKLIATPEINEKLVSQGLKPFYATPDGTAALMRADLDKYAKVIKTANIKLEN